MKSRAARFIGSVLRAIVVLPIPARGGSGPDSIDGGLGNDRINIAFGQESMPVDDLHPGNDLIYGGSGADLISGGTGTDNVYGFAQGQDPRYRPMAATRSGAKPRPAER